MSVIAKFGRFAKTVLALMGMMLIVLCCATNRIFGSSLATVLSVCPGSEPNRSRQLYANVLLRPFSGDWHDVLRDGQVQYG